MQECSETDKKLAQTLTNCEELEGLITVAEDGIQDSSVTEKLKRIAELELALGDARKKTSELASTQVDYFAKMGAQQIAMEDVSSKQGDLLQEVEEALDVFKPVLSIESEVLILANEDYGFTC